MSDSEADSSAPSGTYAQQIVDAVSHDFRGPTRKIKSFLQIFQNHMGDSIDEEGLQYLALVDRAVNSLNIKLEALTRLSNAATAEFEAHPVDLNEVVNQAVKSIGAEIDSSGAILKLKVEGTVLADAPLLRMVFVELLQNSIKFCDAPTQVEIHSQVTEDNCLVRISDSGPGFEAREQQTAFDLFRKFHLAEFPGTGTGLTIVRDILSRHQSSVNIETDKDAGTTVRFALPIASS